MTVNVQREITIINKCNAIYDPSYLSKAIEAIEGFLVQIQRHTKKVIIPSKKELVR